VPEAADEPVRAAPVCLGRTDAAGFVAAGADASLSAGSADNVAEPSDGLSDGTVDVVPGEVTVAVFDELVDDEVDALADDAAVALSDDFADAAEPADFADEDPAGDEDPPVSAPAVPAPLTSAAPTPRAMARPPTRPR
jgi:hypothetical protein